ncbi:MAG: hypothetical protein V4677_13225 [Bacteroidota bacterium]
MAKQLLITTLLFLQLLSFGQVTKVTDVREITFLEVYKDGRLHWTSVKEHNKTPYVIEQFRWNKWIKIGEVDAVGMPTQNQYSFHPAPHHGENIFRIIPFIGSDSTSYKDVRWVAEMPLVKFSVQKKTQEIIFSSETMYEINTISGELMKRGYALSVSIENLPKGNYILNYDNLSTEFKK